MLDSYYSLIQGEKKVNKMEKHLGWFKVGCPAVADSTFKGRETWI
jgi:hypothetical protein